MLDADGNPAGMFSVSTSEGEIVVLFSDLAKWNIFAGLASRALRASGQLFGSVSVEAASFEDAVQQVVDLDPAIVDQAVFIPDTAPVVQDIMKFFVSKLWVVGETAHV